MKIKFLKVLLFTSVLSIICSGCGDDKEINIHSEIETIPPQTELQSIKDESNNILDVSLNGKCEFNYTINEKINSVIEINFESKYSQSSSISYENTELSIDNNKTSYTYWTDLNKNESYTLNEGVPIKITGRFNNSIIDFDKLKETALYTNAKVLSDTKIALKASDFLGNTSFNDLENIIEGYVIGEFETNNNDQISNITFYFEDELLDNINKSMSEKYGATFTLNTFKITCNIDWNKLNLTIPSEYLS